ncbi:MAG TPA: M20/M25/M40 family metallo-hydrolase [Candidatus Saccharimonadales bacterium]|nr:M20/M25/M40 family metallo-hydrolase [Candidatus Saccharimonadales bacterium]
MKEILTTQEGTDIVVNLARCHTPSLDKGELTQETLDNYLYKYQYLINVARVICPYKINAEIFDKDRDPKLVISNQKIPPNLQDLNSWNIDHLEIFHADQASSTPESVKLAHTDGEYIWGNGGGDMGVAIPPALITLALAPSNRTVVFLAHGTEETGSSSVRTLVENDLHARIVRCNDGSPVSKDKGLLGLVPASKGAVRLSLQARDTQFQLTSQGILVRMSTPKEASHHAAHLRLVNTHPIIPFRTADIMLEMAEMLEDDIHGIALHAGEFVGNTPDQGTMIFDVRNHEAIQYMQQVAERHNLQFEHIQEGHKVFDTKYMLEVAKMLAKIKTEIGEPITYAHKMPWEITTFNVVLPKDENGTIRLDIRAYNLEQTFKEEARIRELVDKFGFDVRVDVRVESFTQSPDDPIYQEFKKTQIEVVEEEGLSISPDYGGSDPRFFQTTDPDKKTTLVVTSNQGDAWHDPLNERVSIESLAASMEVARRFTPKLAEL